MELVGIIVLVVIGLNIASNVLTATTEAMSNPETASSVFTLLGWVMCQSLIVVGATTAAALPLMLLKRFKFGMSARTCAIVGALAAATTMTLCAYFHFPAWMPMPPGLHTYLFFAGISLFAVPMCAHFTMDMVVGTTRSRS